jgi:hypothetical protein
MALEMSDKLQFVAGFCHSPTAESHDKLKFVGHFEFASSISPRRTPYASRLQS